MHYLVSILVASSILAVYSVILIIIDQYVSNYAAECKLTINKEKELTVAGGDTLLNGLMANKIFLPSACGGRGTCGFCKCKVTEGAGDIQPTEAPLLTKEEIKNNTRLACQVKVKNDIFIEVPKDMLAAQEFKAKVTKIEDITYDIKLLEFELPAGKEINFKPGQYVQFVVPGTEDFRAYSMASTPRENNKVQLMVRQVRLGLCSSYMHKHLETGDEITFTGPYGDFYLREESEREIICVAGGVGVPPIKSILTHIFTKGTDRKVTYFFGARAKKDLYYYDEPLALAKKHKNFTFVPALSAPDPQDKWTGEKGFIHLAVDKYVKDASNIEAYLCGPDLMIDAVIRVLKAKGLTDEYIYYDKF